eukprot:1711986-Pyramimonas_sp.AAC.1
MAAARGPWPGRGRRARRPRPARPAQPCPRIVSRGVGGAPAGRLPSLVPRAARSQMRLNTPVCVIGSQRRASGTAAL